MDIVTRIVILGILGAILCLLIRKGSPELALVLAIVVSLLVLAFAVQVAGTIVDFVEALAQAVGLSSAVLTPVIRIVGIGIITRLGADVCKDAGQSAIASAIELAGTIAAMYIVMPLMRTVFEMIGGLL